jgi:acyl-coenzyme A synthetase/AMP-(fatty) acid ligase
MLEQLASAASQLQELSEKLDYITWGGGDISPHAGSTVNQKIPIFTSIGSTEMGLWLAVRRKSLPTKDWQYLSFHPSLNVGMQDRGGQVFEAVVKRNKDAENEMWDQPVFKILTSTDSQEFATGDLFVPHPKVEHHWRYFGRNDDMLVFKSGEKFHPVGVEQFLTKKEGIQEVLIVGTGRSQAVLLVKLIDGFALGDIWGHIEEGNQMCLIYARVERNRVLTLGDGKTMLRTGKGAVQRKGTEDLYKKELDDLDK